VLVNGAWDIAGLLEALRADGMRPTALFATSSRVEHVGGPLKHAMAGAEHLHAIGCIPGLRELCRSRALSGAPAYAHLEEADRLQIATSVRPERIRALSDGEVVAVADRMLVRCIHTPGTAPGSMCLSVEARPQIGGCAVGQEGQRAGQRVFVLGGDSVLLPAGSCGRLDQPQACAVEQSEVPSRLQAALDADPGAVLLPGRLTAACPLLAAPLRLALGLRLTRAPDRCGCHATRCCVCGAGPCDAG
jgi:glyoxylase-like metal-dependent hydrolase (beta-lactamase superfamily II)